MKKRNRQTLIFIGPSGSGKGTQAKHLVKDFGFEYIEMGEVLRKIAARPSSFGKKINRIINIKGKLVPDKIMYKIVRREISKLQSSSSVIIEGYPRTLAQAKDLEKILKENKRSDYLVFNIFVPDSVSIERLSKRLICQECKGIYKENDDKDICPKCGGKLIKRQDDTPEKVRIRLSWAHKELGPVVEYYKRKRKIIKINGAQPEEEVYREIVKNIL